MNPQTRSRIVLLVILALFLSSFGVALFLHYSGWEPQATRNHGDFIEPPRDLTAVRLRHADGTEYPWQPGEGVWRVLVLPPRDCSSAACVEMVDTLRRVWVSEGRHADNVHMLWFGEIPEGSATFRNLFAMQPDETVAAQVPESATTEALPVFVTDPSGYLVMHYPAGFDPGGLSRDLRRLIK